MTTCNIFSPEEKFDAVILGTLLNNSIKALTLSSEGKKVLHIERTTWYGGEQEGYIRVSDIPKKGTNGKDEIDEKICIDMSPRVFTYNDSIPKFIVDNGLSHLVDFWLLKKHGIVLDGKIIFIPKSKEDVMLDTSLSLVEKRQFMKILNEGGRHSPSSSFDPSLTFNEWVNKAGIGNLNETVTSLILYGLCQCNSKQEAIDISVSTVNERVKEYFSSLSKLNNSAAFIYPIGGISSIIQAVCRTAAVKGAVYMMNQDNLKIEHVESTSSYLVYGTYEGSSWTVEADEIICKRNEEEYGRNSQMTLISHEALFGCKEPSYWIFPPSANQSKAIFAIHIPSVENENYHVTYAWSQSKADLQSWSEKYYRLDGESFDDRVPTLFYYFN